MNLTDFSATYNSVFTPDQSGEVVFDIYAYGSGRLRINGEEVRGFSNQHGGQKSAYTLQVQAGKTYDVELDFEYFRSDAQLDFDLGFKNEVDVKKSVERVRMLMSWSLWEESLRTSKARRWALSFPDLEEATVRISSCLLSNGN